MLPLLAALVVDLLSDPTGRMERVLWPEGGETAPVWACTRDPKSHAIVCWDLEPFLMEAGALPAAPDTTEL